MKGFVTVLAALVLVGSVEARGFNALGYRMIELDDVVSAGGSIAGTAVVGGEELPATFSVQRFPYGDPVVRYEFALEARRPGDTKPRVRIEGNLKAQSSVKYEETRLTLDVRDYPEESKTHWTFDLTPDGTLGAVLVKKDGFLGIGAREVRCTFR